MLVPGRCCWWLLPSVLWQPLPVVAGRGASGMKGTVAPASGSTGQDSMQRPASPNPLVVALDSSHNHATIEGLDHIARATVFRAESSAAYANATSMRVQRMSLENELKITELKDMLAEATGTGDNAAQFSKEVRDTKEELQTFTRIAADLAKHLAEGKVQDMLTSKYNELKGRSQETGDEEQRAVTSYNHALSVARKRLRKVKAQAAAMKSRSRDLLTEASKLSSSAMEKAVGNPIGAKLDLSDAQLFETRSRQLVTQAETGEETVASLQELVKRNLAARDAAAKYAAFSARRGMKEAEWQKWPQGKDWGGG